MIYVNIEAIKSEGRGEAGGNGWHDTDSIPDAIAAEFARFHRTWNALGHGAAVTYLITVATDASPNRTKGRALPLPVQAAFDEARHD